MNYNNQIPAWSYAKELNKKAQFSNIPDFGIGSGDSSEEERLPIDSQKMARYRGTMIYEIRVPAQPDNPEAELAAADEAALKLYQRVYEAVGDDVPFHNPPERAEQ